MAELASNIVKVTKTQTVSEIIQQQSYIQRQNFKDLQTLISQSIYHAPTFYPITEHPGPNPEAIKILKDQLPKLKISGLDELLLNLEKYKVADFMLADAKWGVPGLFQKGEKVNTMRLFGPLITNLTVWEALVEWIDVQEHNLLLKNVYIHGTPEGFAKRLEKYLRTPVVSPKEALEGWALDPIDILKKQMPMRKNASPIPTWGQKDALDIAKDIEITGSSSAGPPLWVPKRNCMTDIISIMNALLTAHNEGEINNFLKEHPTLLLAECKNKEDRYAVEKIYEKTRPYFNFSAPIQFYMSALMQPFTENLDLFYNKGSNAYGFSYMHGGGKKLWEWALSVQQGKPKAAIYGDDTKIVWMTDGVIYEVNPDFEQQDASLHQYSINVALKYLKQHIEHDPTLGKLDGFQDFMVDLWAQLAVNANFIIHKNAIFSKTGSLRTGIVGTTYFDTVISILAYETLFHARIDLHDSKAVTDFMQRNFGLRIKAGTYVPKRINPNPREGEIVLEQFLGMKLKMIMGQKCLEPVPFIERSTLISMLAAPKQVPLKERTTQDRYNFDFARGCLMLAVHHQELWNALATIIDKTPHQIKVMRTQDGNGQAPEFRVLNPSKIMGQDEEKEYWLSSDGYPNPAWVLNKFLHEENHLEDEKWIYPFPGITSDLNIFRAKLKQVTLVRENETEEVNWADESDADYIRANYVNKPFEELNETTPTMKTKYIIPKNAIKYHTVDKEKNQDIILNGYSQATGASILSRLIEMTTNVPAKNILKHFTDKGWGVTIDGYFTTDKTQMTTKILPNAWSTQMFAALMDLDTASISTQAELLIEKPVPYERLDTIEVDDRWKYPAKIEENIGYLASFVQMNGIPALWEFELVSESPPLNVATFKMLGKRFEVGRKTKIEAKKVIADHLGNILKGFMPEQDEVDASGFPTIEYDLLQDIASSFDIKVPNIGTATQYVKQLFASNNAVMTITTKVISQNPNKLLLTVRSRGQELAKVTSENKKIAETIVMNEIFKHLETALGQKSLL